MQKEERGLTVRSIIIETFKGIHRNKSKLMLGLFLPFVLSLLIAFPFSIKSNVFISCTKRNRTGYLMFTKDLNDPPPL